MELIPCEAYSKRTAKKFLATHETLRIITVITRHRPPEQNHFYISQLKPNICFSLLGFVNVPPTWIRITKKGETGRKIRINVVYNNGRRNNSNMALNNVLD
jgi:hypothetical protein